MITIQVEDLEPWFCSCRRFDTDAAARAAWVRVSDSDKTGRLNIGVYRHGRIGLDKGAPLVSVVGMEPDKVEEAEGIIGGEEIELHQTSWLQLIKRRAEVVMQLADEGKRAGRYVVEHKPGGDRLE